ncbi:MAG: CYTH domain-containing protein [Saprospiraceae bacterium]|nr:MAG: CYTH domain-containing protein [Saprospiraceae bacterium]
MGLEIERKFLLAKDTWRQISDQGIRIRQGYLNLDIERTVRVRVVGDQGKLTIKGKTVGTTRLEFEYDIPSEEAVQLLELCERPLIEKVRYIVKDEGNIWEIDEFDGANKGLLIAEIELGAESQTVNIPDWIGEEVSHDIRYYNSSLIKKPYGEW